jgi:hypothetical protein
MFGCSGNIQDLMWCQLYLFVALNTVQPGIADSAGTALEAALVDLGDLGDLVDRIDLAAHKPADQTGPRFQAHLMVSSCSWAHPAVAHSVVARGSNCSGPNDRKLASHNLTVGTAIAEAHTRFVLVEVLVVVAGAAAIAAAAVEDYKSGLAVVVVGGYKTGRAAAVGNLEAEAEFVVAAVVVDSLAVESDPAAALDLGLGGVDSWNNSADAVVDRQQLAFLPALS